MMKKKLMVLIPVTLIISILFGNSNINGRVNPHQILGLEIGDSFYFDANIASSTDRARVTITERLDSNVLGGSIIELSSGNQFMQTESQNLYSNEGWQIGRKLSERLSINPQFINATVSLEDPVSQEIEKIINFDPTLKQTQTVDVHAVYSGSGYNMSKINDTFYNSVKASISESDTTRKITFEYDGSEVYFINGLYIEIYRYFEIIDSWSTRGTYNSTYYDVDNQIIRGLDGVVNDTGDLFQRYDVLSNGSHVITEESAYYWADRDPDERYVTSYLHKYSPDLHIVVSRLSVASGAYRLLLDFNIQNFDASTLTQNTLVVTNETTITEQAGVVTETETATTTIGNFTKTETEGAPASFVAMWMGFVPIVLLILLRRRSI